MMDEQAIAAAVPTADATPIVANPIAINWNIRLSIGVLQIFDDEFLQYLLGMLPGKSLHAMRAANRMCYTHATEEQLWRSLTGRAFGGHVVHTGNWRTTYWATLRRRQGLAAKDDAEAPPVPQVPGFASTFLFSRWQCMTRQEKASRDCCGYRASCCTARH